MPGDLVQEQTEHSPVEAVVEHPSATELIRSMALSSAELWHSVLQRLEEVSENQRVLARAIAELGAVVQSSLLDPGAASALPGRALAALAGELPAGTGGDADEAAAEAEAGSARARRRSRRRLRFRRRRTEGGAGAETAPPAEAETAPPAWVETAPPGEAETAAPAEEETAPWGEAASQVEPGPDVEEAPEGLAHEPAAHDIGQDRASKKRRRRRWLRRRRNRPSQVVEPGPPAEAPVPAEASEDPGAADEPTAQVPPIDSTPEAPLPPPPPPAPLVAPYQPAAAEMRAPVEPVSAPEMDAATGSLVLDPPNSPPDLTPPAPRPIVYTPSNWGTAAVSPEPAGAGAPPPRHGAAPLADRMPVRSPTHEDDRQYLRPSRPATDRQLAGDVLASAPPPAPADEQVGQPVPLVISEDITLLSKRRRRLQFRLR